MIKKFILAVLLVISVVGAFAQNSSPVSAEGKRHWRLYERYIAAEEPGYALEELNQIIAKEDFAPAYIKAVEICYGMHTKEYRKTAESLANQFITKFPARADEMRDIMADAEAEEKIRLRKFYDNLIGTWQKGDVIDEPRAMTVSRDTDGNLKISVPKEIDEGDYIHYWQTTYFFQPDNFDGLKLKGINSQLNDAYGVWYHWANGDNVKWEIAFLIPFNQPEIELGKLHVKCIQYIASGRFKLPDNLKESNVIGDGDELIMLKK